MPISEKPITIEITYSNKETQKLGVNVGDRFTAYREYYLKAKKIDVEGKIETKIIRKLKQQCWFKVGDIDCVAYKCQHDDDVMLPVTTCKIITE